MNLEICVGNIEDIYICNKFKNIARLELNQGLSCGGLTPSFNFVKTAINISKHPVVTMIRCREGDFNYTEHEFDMMYEDAKTFLELGVQGIVFGFLNKDKTIDIDKTNRFITLIHKYKKEAIFHRAIDVSDNYLKNIKLLKNMNIDRILTSGHKKIALDGLDNILNACNIFENILVGSGVNTENIHIFKENGIKNIHGSFSELIENDYNINFGKNTITSEEKLQSIDFITF